MEGCSQKPSCLSHTEVQHGTQHAEQNARERSRGQSQPGDLESIWENERQRLRTERLYAHRARALHGDTHTHTGLEATL